MSEKKRRYERRPAFKVCRYNIEGREYADLSTNISTKGIFIKNFEPPPIGTPILLTAHLSEEWGNLPLKILGRVVHVNNDSDPHKRGMGIEFLSVASDSLPIIEYFVREIFNEKVLTEERLEQSSPESVESDTRYRYHVRKKEDQS